MYDEQDLNKLSMFPGESLRHWIAKAVIFYKLREMKHDLLTEIEITGMGVGDLVDLHTNTQYEIELTHMKKVHKAKEQQYRRDGFEIIVVDCHKMPRDIREIGEFLEPYIIPD